jgi:3-oxoacid CoA-transferase subunit B
MRKLKKEEVARRVAKELEEGYYINLGIGMPSLIPNYIPNGMKVTLLSENGIIGLGPSPKKNEVDPDLTNASKQTATLNKGGVITDTVDAFAMIRGGHVDLTVLGGMQVDQFGNLSNWKIPGKKVKGMGGAMDLVAGAKRVIVMMQHVNNANESKILKNCTLPITGKAVVSELYTDIAHFKFKDGKMYLTEYAPETTIEEIRENTEAEFIVSENVCEMDIS